MQIHVAAQEGCLATVKRLVESKQYNVDRRDEVSALAAIKHIIAPPCRWLLQSLTRSFHISNLGRAHSAHARCDALPTGGGRILARARSSQRRGR